eukprot:1098589-Pyramimonas_sp.AAC.1
MPGGAAICETVATCEGCWWVLGSGAPRGPERDLAVPGGLRSAKLSPLSKAAGVSCGVRHRADLSGTSSSLGGCDLRNCRHFRALL